MPLIHRVTHDMFEFSSVCDYLVNPVNIGKVAGAGLAKEFRNRVPTWFDIYCAACASKELRIGTVHVMEETGNNWGIIDFPTKRYYADTSSKEDIIRGLEALRELLKTDRYRYATIAMPMLGCGCGKQDYAVVYPLMIEHLSDLDATVFLSMSPDRTEMRPRYLALAGPNVFPKEEDKIAIIENTVQKAMDAWGMNLSDYAGIVTGGNPGFDAFFGGTDFLKDQENTFIHRKTQGTPLVIKPNEYRNGVAAKIIHDNVICEIADDIILFKPQGVNNNRLSIMQKWLMNDREKRHREGKEPRRIAVSGDKSMNVENHQIKVQIQSMD